MLTLQVPLAANDTTEGDAMPHAPVAGAVILKAVELLSR